MSAVGDPLVTAPKIFFPLVDQLRGVGALLVVYSHLVGNFLESRGRTWPVDTAVDAFVLDPLHAEMNFGWLGVVLFFYVSGFVVTHAAAGEKPTTYIVRRLLRIYPPVVVAAALSAVIAYTLKAVNGVSTDLSIPDVLLGMTLVNYLVPLQPAVIAVGWTLVIEMFFYIGMLLVHPLLRRAPALVPIILITLSALVVWIAPVLAGPDAKAASFAAFVPILVIGQITYFAYRRLIPLWPCAIAAVVAWVVFVAGMDRTSPLFSDPNASFLANTVLGFGIFLAVVLLDGKIRPLRALEVVSRRSYSLYLVHVPVGFTVLVVLVDSGRLGYTLSLVAAVVATAIVTELSYRFVERPSVRLGRWLTGRRVEPGIPRVPKAISRR